MRGFDGLELPRDLCSNLDDGRRLVVWSIDTLEAISLGVEEDTNHNLSMARMQMMSQSDRVREQRCKCRAIAYALAHVLRGDEFDGVGTERLGGRVGRWHCCGRRRLLDHGRRRDDQALDHGAVGRLLGQHEGIDVGCLVV